MILVIIIGTFFTSLISGMFGMAGGVLLMGLYSLVLPVVLAMILHGIAQAFSNGFRTWFFRHHINWKILPLYCIGALLSLGLSFWIAYIPSKEFVFLMLGVVAVLSVTLPMTKSLNIEKPKVAILCGFSVTLMQIFSGVSGPLLDIFYLHSKMDRYQVIANKSLTQTFGHICKLFYYLTLTRATLAQDFTLPYWIIPAIIISAFLGARFGKRLLQYINDSQFRVITKNLILILGLFYIYKGLEEGGHTTRAFTYIKDELLVAAN